MIKPMTKEEVMAFLRENAYPYYNDEESYYKSSWENKYFVAYLQSLPEELLSQVVNQLYLEHNSPRLLLYKAKKILSVKVGSRNAGYTTAQLLRFYKDKKSGKVSMAIKELMRRFNSESQEVQRLILCAFLCGGKKEMEWAGRFLRDHWIRSMSALVAERWRATHNRILAFVALRHMSNAFLLEEQNALADAVGYVYVCARLRDVDGFHFDSDRLSIPEYFYVSAKLDAGHSQTIGSKAAMEYLLDEYFEYTPYFSTNELCRLFWALGTLGMSEALMKALPEARRKEKEATEFSFRIDGSGPIEPEEFLFDEESF